MLSKIEQSVFFPVVRIVTFIGAAVLFLSMISGLIFAITFNGVKTQKVRIPFSEIQTIVSSETSSEKENVELTIPENVEKHLGSYTDIFGYKGVEAWLDRNTNFETMKETNVFLKDLSKIIASAEKKDIENVEKYIDVYMDLYEQKTSDDGFYAIIEKFSPVIKSVVVSAIISAAFALFGLFVMMIILLLLLSIEKNTRKNENF